MSDTLDIKTLEAAATWYVALNQGDEQACKAHAEWLRSHPHHAQAWARVERLQASFGRLDGVTARPLLQATVVDRRSVLKVLGVLMAASAAGLAASVTPWQGALATYRTATAQRQQVRLPDGTQVTLNTRTAMGIDFSATQRLITLHHGELLVGTAADPGQRPLIVQLAQGRIHTHAARFLVRSENAWAQASVLEQAIEVANADATVHLEAGQQLRFTASSHGAVLPLQAGAGAWSGGQLEVSGWPLGAFIDELSRYRPGHLACDPAVAGLRVSGAFQLGDTDRVLDNLSGTLPVRINRFTRYWATVEPA
ncbi:FecR domain-containing protein [Pseudomonas sp. S36]|uniref:FecR domain-containing protein n=1 Tax=Pseudomonas sp. S36 TaxID=2767447 RepID=UPI001911B043|nr:FecR domain-containing protein [Pseudomonas sp. S36]MBK4988499.1 DUF4880 domain-containing protein [Pseudomonas sp. S36]